MDISPRNSQLYRIFEMIASRLPAKMLSESRPEDFRRGPQRARGFTLVELLVSTAILALIVLLVARTVSETGTIVRRTAGKVEQFQSARAGFERIVARLSQATLNTFYDYDDPIAPRRYLRQSELRFLCGSADKVLPQNDAARVSHCVFFCAPLGYSDAAATRGLDKLLNVTGYYVEYGDDRDARPTFLAQTLPPRYRFRLKEYTQPTNVLNLYRYTSGLTAGKLRNESYNGLGWFRDSFSTASNIPTSRTVAENIVALILVPRLPKAEEASLGGSGDLSPLAPRFAYNSRSTRPQSTDDPSNAEQPDSGTSTNSSLNPSSQLPPLIQVTMVAIDEASTLRLGFKRGDSDYFDLSKRFRDTRQLTKDLSSLDPSDHSLTALLIEKGIRYRIFTTTVSIRAAKWSRAL